MTELSKLSDEQLMKMERDIARKYMNTLSWPMVIWPFVNVGTWLALWPLVFYGILPLWGGFLIALCTTTLAYLPSHEAQHDIYARPGEKLRWLNQLIGHFSLIPLAYSYRLLRETHMEHHKHTNDPKRDPDQLFNDEKSGWGSIKNTIQSFQPGSPHAKIYLETMEKLDTPECRLAIRDQVLWTLLHNGVLIAMALNGYALEAALLWWLPMKLAIIYVRFYLSWAPHYPGDKLDRYGNTRTFKSWLGAWSSLGMTAHLVHHLHPRIPLTRTPTALREMLPLLRTRNCDLTGHAPG